MAISSSHDVPPALTDWRGDGSSATREVRRKNSATTAYWTATVAEAIAARRGEPVNGRAARMMKYTVQIGDFTARSGSPSSP